MSRATTQFKPGQSGNKRGRPPGLPNKATRQFKEWAERFFTSPDYRQKVERRIVDGKAQQLEVYMLQMLYGKPIEQMEVSDLRRVPDAVTFTIRRAAGAENQT